MADLRTRKRKSARDSIFEVNDKDVSPVPSPSPDEPELVEPPAKSVKTQAGDVASANLKSLEERTNSDSEQNEADKEINENSVNEILLEDEGNAVNIEVADVQNSDADLSLETVNHDVVSLLTIEEPAVIEEGHLKADEEFTAPSNVMIGDADIVANESVDNEQVLSEDVIEEAGIEQMQNKNLSSVEDQLNTSSEINTEENEKKCDFEQLHSSNELNISDESQYRSKHGSENVLVTVHFKSKQIGELFKDKMLGVLSSISEFKVIDNVSFENRILLLQNTECESSLLKILSDTEKHKKKKKKPVKAEKSDMFTLDTNPTYSKHANEQLQYLSKFSLEDNDGVKQLENQNTATTCFNCSENHNLRDCPYPKNFVKINKAKSKYKKVTRYHLDEDQKYCHLKPGKITHKLREALGLRNNDLPAYIYRMRHLGYPPGWVEEAFESHSELSLFDSDGNSVNMHKKADIKINPDKIIEYPGFNAGMDKYMKDEFEFHRSPRYSKHINKESILEVIKKFKDNLESCDMDIENEPEEEKVSPPGCEEASSIIRLSPSLTDLEQQKLKLLAELDQGESSRVVKLDDKEVVQVENAEEKETAESGDESNSCGNEVKTSSFGTPIFQRKSPYCTLPDPDKFSLNMTPVINFENLPNSTGKYEQMTGVLQKVRRTLKDLSKT